MSPRRDATPEVVARLRGRTVEVYRNLHRGCWSVRVGGLVALHTDAVHVEAATFKVSEAGRQRALREGARNVHATIRGIFVACGARVFLPEARTLVSVTYAHTAGPTFTRRDTGAPVQRAAAVYLRDRAFARDPA